MTEPDSERYSSSGADIAATRALSKRPRLDRVQNACDLCKSRKVKCDGQQPCSYCVKKSHANSCVFSGPKRRQHDLAQRKRTATSDGCEAQHSASRIFSPETPGPDTRNVRSEDRDDRQDTDVPLEARLLRDTHGKVIFIGDCAPLSFLQTIRQLIAASVSDEDLHVQLPRDSILEVIPKANVSNHKVSQAPFPSQADAEMFLEQFWLVTSGLVDLYDRKQLAQDVSKWVQTKADDDREGLLFPSSTVLYLVMAIGAQERDETKAEVWFQQARTVLLTSFCTEMTLSTVQGFALMAIYMLQSFQPNGAYLFFSLAARSGYAIGLHRTEVNASFGGNMLETRDRIWKSLRVVDMLLSNLLGRPTSAADIDCTVKYDADAVEVPHHMNALHAHLQIFLVIERIVLEVYSRKRVSLRIASYISHQLKMWASKWLHLLTDITEPPKRPEQTMQAPQDIVSACHALCTYYYGIMLLTRPFLVYQLYEHLGASLRPHGTRAEHKEKGRYAGAALDAATRLVDTVSSVIDAGVMPFRMPMIVAWLFTGSLVLAVSLLGREGLALESVCRTSLQCLEYFAQVDPHARQYATVARTLFETTRSHVSKIEERGKAERQRASAQLFGMFAHASEPMASQRIAGIDDALRHRSLSSHFPPTPNESSSSGPLDWTLEDADLFALPWLNEDDPGLEEFLQPSRQAPERFLPDIPLFPMCEQLAGPVVDANYCNVASPTPDLPR